MFFCTKLTPYKSFYLQICVQYIYIDLYMRYHFIHHHYEAKLLKETVQ